MRAATIAFAMLAAVALALGATPSEAKAAKAVVTLAAHHGHPGYDGHHRGYSYHGRHGCHGPVVIQPRVYGYPPVVVPYSGYPAVVRPPVYPSYPYYPYPSATFQYRGRGFGLSIGF